MIIRLFSLLLLGWMLGFAWFAITLPRPADGRATDAIVVVTGGKGRIDRGLAMLDQGSAKQMLISGVDRDVRPRELAAEYDAPMRVFDCCVTLGREAIDTRSNAIETSRWIERRNYKTIRLITTDWHMRRAAYELKQAVPPGTQVLLDAVQSRPSLSVLLKEYNKYLLRRGAGLFGV